MTHIFATALQQACRIRQRRAVKEPDVHMSSECIDVTEWRISYACDRTAVVHEFPNVVATLSHDVKPFLRDRSQFACLFFHPRIDGGIPLDPTGEPKVQSIHSVQRRLMQRLLGRSENR